MLFLTIIFYICYDDLWSVIFAVITVVVLRCHKLCSYKMANLTDKCYVYSDCSTNRFPISPHCLRPPYSLRYPVLKLGQRITPQWASKCSHERKSHTPSPLNQKLEMIELCEEAILKVEIGQKLGTFPEVSQVVNAKEKKILKKIKGTTRTNTWIREWSSVIDDMGKVWVVWIAQTSHSISLSQSLIQSIH